MNLGNALRKTRQLEAAVTRYRQALALLDEDKNLPQSAHRMAGRNLALALSQLGRHAEAIACCRERIAADPDNAEIHSLLGTELLRQREPREALDYARRAPRSVR